MDLLAFSKIFTDVKGFSGIFLVFHGFGIPRGPWRPSWSPLPLEALLEETGGELLAPIFVPFCPLEAHKLWYVEPPIDHTLI